MLDRTMKAIAERYDTRRNEILTSIREGKISASMSNIDYYPKPWAELDVSSPNDLSIISTALTWDGAVHTHEGLRAYKERELELRAERSSLMFKPHEERKERIREIDVELNALIARTVYPID